MVDTKLKKHNKTSMPTRIIEVGKFYLVFEGSSSGHPGYIIWKNDEHNLYLAIKFGTTPNKDNKKLNCSLRQGDKENYVFSKLFLGKRKNIGKNELAEMNIAKEKLDDVLRTIDFLNFTWSPDINSKDRYQYKRGIKKSPHYKGQLSCPKGTADVNNIQSNENSVKKNNKIK